MTLASRPDPRLVDRLAAAITQALEQQALEQDAGRMLVVGITGAQGSGKSTLAACLADRLEREGVPTAVLSLDDLYLTRTERGRTAREIHPLFATRGAPGTHDIALGLRVLDALASGEPVLLPRFDKAMDDRAPQSAWTRAPAGTRVLLFEGWCVGAVAQPDAALAEPVNALEAREDATGAWRRHANGALAGPYRALFDRVGLLILLAAPGFDVVRGWREEQEAELRQHGGANVMSPAEVERFIQHYERLTRHILQEMPGRADIVVCLGPHREVLDVRT